MIDIEKNKKVFINYLDTYCNKRDGIDRIKDMLNRTDFFIAPASKKYHLAIEGGTCEHSLGVLHEMVGLVALDSKNTKAWAVCEKFRRDLPLSIEEDKILDDVSREVFGEKIGICSVVLTALLHDCHKINFYEKVEKSVYKGLDEKGKKIFEVEPSYQMREDRLIFGNSGTNSNYIITAYMKLTYDEQLAIENHHGVDINNNQLPASSTAWSNSKFALYLHLADMKAAFTEGK